MKLSLEQIKEIEQRREKIGLLLSENLIAIFSLSIQNNMPNTKLLEIHNQFSIEIKHFFDMLDEGATGEKLVEENERVEKIFKPLLVSMSEYLDRYSCSFLADKVIENMLAILMFYFACRSVIINP